MDLIYRVKKELEPGALEQKIWSPGASTFSSWSPGAHQFLAWNPGALNPFETLNSAVACCLFALAHSEIMTHPRGPILSLSLEQESNTCSQINVFL